MRLNILLRHAAGFALGGIFFLVIIPGLIFLISVAAENLSVQPIIEDEGIRKILSLILSIPGIIFLVWSNAALLLTGKGGPAEGFGIEISPKTKYLVKNGPYRYTRNPMVFGVYTLYLVFSFYLNSYISLLAVLMFLPLIILYLKRSEEKRLIRDFGEDYRKYRESVPLFIPLPPKK